MSGKENCNSFNEFIRLAEQNSRALGDGTEVVKVQPFWLGSESKFKSVPERAQAAMLGLAWCQHQYSSCGSRGTAWEVKNNSLTRASRNALCPVCGHRQPRSIY